MYYQSPDNKLHWLDFEEHEYILPPGSVKLTDMEAEEILNVNIQPDIKKMSPLEFIERFTDEEQLSIVTKAMETPALRLWYDKLMAAGEVLFDDSRLLEGMGVLVSYGLIDEARRDEILS